MGKREILALAAIQDPDSIVDEVADFYLFLKTRKVEYDFDALSLSYATIAKDWFSPEEDEAWKDYQ
jgi:hypothetical protein